jgi:hypothetical protein
MAVRGVEIGGDGWESNPPRTPQQRPANGFEDRGEHQLPYIPDDRARLSTGLDGYSLSDWGLAFTATASAAAALTGLLFVALSINLKQIIANPGLVARAIEVLIVLSAALILSTLLLMPGQPNGAAATEIIITAVAVSAVTGRIQILTDRRALGISRLAFASRVLGAHTGPLFLVVGAISLLAQSGGGLYWVVPALLAMIIVSIIGAWIMLVEILR